MKKEFLLITSALLLTANCFMPGHVSAQVMQLYGMTAQGGTNSEGIIFQFHPADSAFTKRLDFPGTSDGTNPYGSLMQASDGYLYGMTYGGGANSDGVLFQFNTITSTCVKKIDFAGTSNGSSPRGSLIQATDGNLYGMTEVGGANNEGVLFQYNPVSSAYADKYDFGAIGVSGPTGEYPYGSLIQATDGNLYGMTSAGGPGNFGTLFQYDPLSANYAVKINFTGAAVGVSGTVSAVGAHPFGSLVQATNGNLYGMTYQGGASGEGVLFQYNPVSSVYAEDLNFGAIGGTGTTNGIYPNGSLIQATDGNLYGMTYQGGVNNYGVLFQYNPTSTVFTKKFDFDGTANGSYPYGTLMQASDGNIYGMTSSGGASNDGVLFQYNPVTSALTKMLDFSGTNGDFPGFSNLIEIAASTGINPITSENYVALAPNPATNQLTVRTSSFQNEMVTVSVMNVLGEIMQEEKLKWSNDISMNIKDLPSGIYFLQMRTEKESVVKRFVKE